MSLENEQKEIKPKKSEELGNPKLLKSPSEERQGRISEIDEEIKRYNYKASSPEEINVIQKQRDEEYQKQLQNFKDLNISEESKGLIHLRMVEEEIEFAQKDNEKFNDLQKEKNKLMLYNNLELGENPEESISKAKKAIEAQDENGEKIKIFNEALEYYSRPQEKIADVPIYHGAGSHSLYKIIEQGALDSSKNIFGGEKSITSKSHGGTSFAIGGYEESEIASHLYTRKSNKDSRLIVDSKNILGEGMTPGEEILDVIHRQLSKLKPEERKFVEEDLKKQVRKE